MLALAVLAACTTAPAGPPDEAPEQATAPDDAPTSAATPGDDPVVRGAPGEGGDEGGDEPTGGSELALAPCPDRDRDAMVTALDGQLAAIRAAEWDRALTFATPGFRADVDAEDFASIIADGFPVVADSRSRDLGSCSVVPDGREASMLVVVADGDGAEQTLLYLFEEVEGGWGIAGALPSGGRPVPAEPTITA